MRRLLSPVAHAAACETPRKLARLALSRHSVPCVTAAVFALLLAGTSPPAVARLTAVSPVALEAGGQGQTAPGAAQESAQRPEQRNEEHGGRGAIDVIARVLNFAILAGTLIYLLRTPVQTYLRDRSTQIRRDLVTAVETKQAAAAALEEIDRKMKALPGELEALRAQGAQETAAEEARILAAAAAERDRLLDQARREIDQQVKIAERDLLSDAADLAIGVASERIKKSITDEDQKRLVERYVQRLKS